VIVVSYVLRNGLWGHGRRTDGRKEEGKSVKRAICAHVDDHVKPLFPVLATGPEILHFEHFTVGTSLIVLFEAANGERFLFWLEEGRFIGEVVHHPVACKANQNSY